MVREFLVFPVFGPGFAQRWSAMTPPSIRAPEAARASRADARLAQAEALLAQRERSVDAPVGAAPASARVAAVATALMDEYRRTRCPEAFESLVRLSWSRLYGRVCSRLRSLGVRLDPNEVLQDTIINVYRYPDRFDAARPGAFAAWSSTIVDNTIRRQLRRQRGGAALRLVPEEQLVQQPDRKSRGPDLQAQDREECAQTLIALQLLLAAYLAAFEQLSERERFVLQMVEIKGMRYAQLAQILQIRPEALKMVVFRARRRILERMSRRL